MVTVRDRSKIKKAENRFFFSQIKSRKEISIFCGRFNGTIPVALVGYEMIIANSYPTRTRGIIVE